MDYGRLSIIKKNKKKYAIYRIVLKVNVLIKNVDFNIRENQCFLIP